MDSKLTDQKDIQTTMPEVDVQATWRKHGWTPPSERIKPIPEKKESIPSILKIRLMTIDSSNYTCRPLH